MSTTIKTLNDTILNYNLAEGIAVFLPDGLNTIRADAEPFLRSFGVKKINSRSMSIYSLPKPVQGKAKHLVFINNHEKAVESFGDMRKQVFGTLNALKGKTRNIAMNGIKIHRFSDQSARPEAYQWLAVREYIAKYPDAFDTVSLVDKRGGFENCMNEILDKMVQKIVENYDRWLNNDYMWPMQNGRPINGNERRTKYEAKTVGEFSRYSNNLISARTRRTIRDAVEGILKWGELPDINGSSEPRDFTDAIIRMRNNDYDCDDIVKQGERDNRPRIAFWSKVLAAYKPGKLFIYDSRVALALAYISLNAGTLCFWNIPQGEGDILGMHFCDDIQRTVKKSINKNQRDKGFVSDDIRIKKADIPTCYQLYLCLLNKLAANATVQEKYNRLVGNDIKDAYETAYAFETNPDKRRLMVVMAHLEKMLFMMKEKILAEYQNH